MPFSSVRLVLGVPICFKCETEQINEVVCRIYPSCPSSNVKADIEISLKHVIQAARDLDFPPRFDVNDTRLIARSGSSHFSARRDEKSGEAFLCQRILEDEYAMRHHVLYTLCYYLLSHHHYLPVHAACFQLNGHLLLCFGKSGAGKSTLAMAALQQGFPVVSEDLCFIGRDQMVGVKSDCREIHLFADSYALFEIDEDRELSISHNGKSKYVIPNQQKSEGSICLGKTPSKVVLLFLEPSNWNRETRIEEISGEACFEEILYPEENGFNLISNARIPAVNWLRKKTAYTACIGQSFEQFFKYLDSTLDELTCAIQ